MRSLCLAHLRGPRTALNSAQERHSQMNTQLNTAAGTVTDELESIVQYIISATTWYFPIYSRRGWWKPNTSFPGGISCASILRNQHELSTTSPNHYYRPNRGFELVAMLCYRDPPILPTSINLEISMTSLLCTPGSRGRLSIARRRIIEHRESQHKSPLLPKALVQITGTKTRKLGEPELQGGTKGSRALT